MSGVGTLPRPAENRRVASPRLPLSFLGIALLLLVPLAAALLGERGLRADFDARLLPPSLEHWFGTDPMGRDMAARTVKGLSLSLGVGLLAAAISTAIAITLALAAGLGRWADAAVSFLVDAALSLPHLILLILLAFAFGGGTGAVILAVALTHWPRLTRILRAERMQVEASEFVHASRSFGKSRGFILRRHLLSHLLPQALVGFVLLFPHAILHEAALTFIGFGLELSRPAIGVLLADAMRYLAGGQWWLALFPGLCLLLVAMCLDSAGNRLRAALDPRGRRS